MTDPYAVCSDPDCTGDCPLLHVDRDDLPAPDQP
jgi:hypothetical protein